MPVLKINIRLIPGEDAREILTARLSAAGFEGFIEQEDSLETYTDGSLPESDAEKSLKEVLPAGAIYSIDTLPDINWNEEWEKNFHPVSVGDKCHVRAPFHPPRPGVPVEIVIEPRMSFGTAHHETTQMMMEWLLEAAITGKSLLDMGCGTGILAILANKLGAADVMAVDNDEWAWRNARDNFMLNNLSPNAVYFGDARLLDGLHFDIIMANINRNILVDDLPAYAQALNPGGMLFISGFYEADRPAVVRRAVSLGLQQAAVRTNNNWVSVKLFKQDSK